jgi:hypothetical protein
VQKLKRFIEGKAQEIKELRMELKNRRNEEEFKTFM